ncbi:hypothetical protein CB1_000342006 [Camelus ferus]|nr:hypothetical protein CB1_000342006 [Camelus ferus]
MMPGPQGSGTSGTSSSSLTVSFPSPVEAEMAGQSLAPRVQPYQGAVQKELIVSGNILAIVNPEDSSRNMYIGDHNQGTGCESHRETEEEQRKLVGPRAGEREFEQWMEITEVGDKVRPTELE